MERSTPMLDPDSDEDVSEELFGTNINLLNTDDASDSEASGEEGDGTSASARPGHISDGTKSQVVADIVELNRSAGDWKVNGFKCRKKPMEVFLHSLGLSFLLQSLLEANVYSTQAFLDIGQEATSALLESIGATDNDIHKFNTVLFTNENQVGQGKPHIKDTADKIKPIISFSEQECLKFLQENIPVALKLDYEKIKENHVTGKDLLSALESTRELVEVFGLDSCSKRVEFEKAVRLTQSSGLSMPSNSTGSVYSALYLERVRPLYDLHMGCENMAPQLYSMVRFLKVQNILEVGAGYTSIFLLQALHDNQLEIENLAKLNRAGQCSIDKQPYCVGQKLEEIHKRKSILHCVDHMGHAHTTANKVLEIAKDLNIDSHLQLHDIDFWEFDLQYEDEEEEIDFIWLDFAAGSKLNEVFNRWWGRLKNGGFILCHSTLTNSMTREWLEDMRKRENNKWTFESVSFLEPHKYFQNSFSMFQKRENNYKEDILTRYP